MGGQTQPAVQPLLVSSHMIRSQSVTLGPFSPLHDDVVLLVFMCMEVTWRACKTDVWDPPPG